MCVKIKPIQFKSLKYIKYEEDIIINNKVITLIKEEKSIYDQLSSGTTDFINDQIKNGFIKNILSFKGVIQ